MWYSLLDLIEPAPGELLARVRVDASSPWFAGHFPGNPILPGIAQLHLVASVLARGQGPRPCLRRLSRVKFKKIVRPGEALEIHAARPGATGPYTFRVTHGEQEVCSGMMTIDD